MKEKGIVEWGSVAAYCWWWRLVCKALKEYGITPVDLDSLIIKELAS